MSNTVHENSVPHPLCTKYLELSILILFVRRTYTVLKLSLFGLITLSLFKIQYKFALIQVITYICIYIGT